MPLTLGNVDAEAEALVGETVRDLIATYEEQLPLPTNEEITLSLRYLPEQDEDRATSGNYLPWKPEIKVDVLTDDGAAARTGRTGVTGSLSHEYVHAARHTYLIEHTRVPRSSDRFQQTEAGRIENREQRGISRFVGEGLAESWREEIVGSVDPDIEAYLADATAEDQREAFDTLRDSWGAPLNTNMRLLNRMGGVHKDAFYSLAYRFIESFRDEFDPTAPQLLATPGLVYQYCWEDRYRDKKRASTYIKSQKFTVSNWLENGSAENLRLPP